MAQEASTVTGSQAEASTENCINGHAYVDLGLSVKWATCNVGASSPADYGDYFAWGETMTKDLYNKDNSVTFKKKKYNHDIGGDDIYDAATANWGSAWRMPTEAEFRELKEQCTWKWTTQDDHHGYKVTSKKNGNAIFLPAAGFCSSRWILGRECDGSYWGSSPYGSDSHKACELSLTDVWFHVSSNDRFMGHSVRPVSK